MFYVTMVMHKPEDHPKGEHDVLILVKGETNFKIGGISDGHYHVREVEDFVKYEDSGIEMWCEIPTKDTIHKVNSL